MIPGSGPDKVSSDKHSPARPWEIVAAFATYAALSFFFFGIPLLQGFDHYRLGYHTPGDPQVYIWGLAWYPYALSHRLDPLFTTMVWAPTGYNLTWSTTVPGAALLMWPVTRLFGPLVSYNVLCVLTPALGAFTTFLLCRYVASGFWEALAGGYAFGFSTYVLSQLVEHLVEAMVFLIPIFPYLCLIFLDRRIARWKFIALLSAILAAQFLLSLDIFATTTFFGTVTLLMAFWLCDQNLRSNLRNLTNAVATAYAVAIVVLLPFILRLFPSPLSYFPLFNPEHFSADLINFFLPIEPSLLAHSPAISRLAAHIDPTSEATAYLGLLPLVAVFFAVSSSRSVRTKLLLGLLGITIVASLGPVLHVDGHVFFPLPWLPMLVVPLINSALPVRFTLYVFLVLAVILAIWLSQSGGFVTGRWLLGSAALLSLLPTLPMTQYSVRENLPRFFEQQLSKEHISPNDVVLVLPYQASGNAMLWQATGNFGFRMAQGYLLAELIPPSFAQWPIVQALVRNEPYIPEYHSQFLTFLTHYGIKTVIVDSVEDPKFRALFDDIHFRRTETAGVVLYQIDPAEFAAFESLTASDMEMRYQLDRFTLLLHATRQALDAGISLQSLSATELQRRGLLSAALTGFEYPPITQPFHRLTERVGAAQLLNPLMKRILRHAESRYRLMAAFGMAPPEGLTSTGVWVGPWQGDNVAIGLAGDPQSLSEIIVEYGPKAEQVLYPYPETYRSGKSPSDARFLLMVFTRAALPATDRVTPNSRQSRDRFSRAARSSGDLEAARLRIISAGHAWFEQAASP